MDLQEQIGLIVGVGVGAYYVLLVELLRKKHGWALIRAWALNRDITNVQTKLQNLYIFV